MSAASASGLVVSKRTSLLKEKKSGGRLLRTGGLQFRLLTNPVYELPFTHHQSHPLTTWTLYEGDTRYLSELRIVLLGSKGTGKTSAGNSILGREEFDLKRSAQCVRRHGEAADRHLTVIEAPGWWSEYTVEQSPELLKQEIVLSVSLCPPGPHAVLLIIRVDNTFKETTRKALQGHLELLGEGVWSHTIVLFTYGDYLLDTSIEQHIESEGQDLRWLVDRCGNRYHVLNNKNRSDHTQIKELLEKIEETVAQNKGCHFEIDGRILQEMKKRRREVEERANERMRRMQKQRDDIRSQMMRRADKSDTWSLGSSAYSSLGSRSGADSRSDSDLDRRCKSMGVPSPFMSGDERSDTMFVRSSAYSSNMSEADEDSS